MKDRKTPKEISKKPPVQPPIDNSRKFMDDVFKCTEVLKAGGIILYPTDTVWGIGCDATNENAVTKLYQLKQREESQPVVALVEHPDRVGRYIKSIPEAAIQLLEVNDKPMTIIYPGAVNLASNVVAADGSVGLRITSDEFCRKLIGSFNKPIVFESANESDEADPENFRDIEDVIKKGVDYAVKWRQNDPTPGVTDSIIKVGIKGEIGIVRQ